MRRFTIAVLISAPAAVSCAQGTPAPRAAVCDDPAGALSKRSPNGSPEAFDLDKLYRAASSAAPRPLTPDPALAETAHRIADRVAQDPSHRAPDDRVVQALAWSASVWDPCCAFVSAVVDDAAAAAALLAGPVAEMTRDTPYDRIGIGIVRASDGRSAVALALSRRLVTWSSTVPTQVAVGTCLTLEGVLAPELAGPKLAILEPDGTSRKVLLGDGPRFRYQRVLENVGRYQVELLGDSPGGTMVLANFPIHAGIDPPPPPNGEARAHDSPEKVETELLELLNQDRHAERRAPVRLWRDLHGVARAHSEDMASHHFFAHVSPRTGAPIDRLHRANLSACVMLENIARGYTAKEIHAGFIASPGHREILLDPRVTRIGIGVVASTVPSGPLFITEDFAGPSCSEPTVGVK